MFKFTSLSGGLVLQLIIHCLFSPAMSLVTSEAGTFWRSFDGVSPTHVSSASPMPARGRGRCALECQGRVGCHGFFYNDVSSMCVNVTSESDIQSGPSVSGFRYYTNKYTCPKETTNTLTDLASSSCFVVKETPGLLWEAARGYCNSTGGQLAVLDTRGKVVFLVNAMRNSPEYTLGHYHLGARRPPEMFGQPWPDSGQDFVWVNGQPLDVTVAAGYWADTDPSGWNGGDNFIALWSASRLWIDATDYAGGYICQ